MPDHIYEKLTIPELQTGLEFYFSAYQDLVTERVSGMSQGQIPWSKIVTWCNHYGITDTNEIDTINRYIRAIEAEEIRWRIKESKKKQPVT